MSSHSKIVQVVPKPKPPVVPGFVPPRPAVPTGLFSRSMRANPSSSLSGASPIVSPQQTFNTENKISSLSLPSPVVAAHTSQVPTYSYYTAPPHPSHTYIYPPPPLPTHHMMQHTPPQQVGYGFLTPPPAPVIGSLSPAPSPNIPIRAVSDNQLTDPSLGIMKSTSTTSRDSRLLTSTTVKDPDVEEKVVFGIGIRQDIYDISGGSSNESEKHISYHRIDETPGHSRNDQEDVNRDEVTSTEVTESVDLLKEETKLKDELKISGSGNYRCDFCPSPGLVPWEEKITHQADHTTSCFSCAACNGRRTFPEFAEVVRHIHSLHQVTDSEMVLETILLPQTVGGLRMFRCGVKNCGKTFLAQSEIILKSHMEQRHGNYYVKVGRGKYIHRFCRICGDDRKFGSEKELDSHIELSHPPDQFGQKLSDDEDDENDTGFVNIKQEPGEHMTDDLPLGNLSKGLRTRQLDSNVLSNQTPPPAPLEELSTQTSRAEIESNPNMSDEVSTTTSLNPGVVQPVSKPPSEQMDKDSKEEGEIVTPEVSPQKLRSRSCSTDISKRSGSKKKRKRESSSASASENDSEKDESKKKKKHKRRAKLKAKKSKRRKDDKIQTKLEEHDKNLRQKVEDMSPEELLVYLNKTRMKKKQIKEKKDKNRVSSGDSTMCEESVMLPEPKVPYPRDLNNSAAHYYCLVCSIYVGKLEKWSKHRNLREHVVSYISTKEAAMKKHNCADINLQECVIGESKFQEAPLGQCRECLMIFWSRLEHGLHLQDGRCIKILEKEKHHSPSSIRTASSSRSPSPNIIWKPLRPAADDPGRPKPPVTKSPSPESSHSRGEKGSVQKVSFPKYMLDGKTAYFICKLCVEPVGHLLAWLEHKNNVKHKTAYRIASLTEKMDEVIIANSPSVLHKFGDKVNSCLSCNVNFPSNAQLFSHEQSEAHRDKFRVQEQEDREHLRVYSSGLENLFYCDLCMVSTCSLPSSHQTTREHIARLEATVLCNYCPKRLDPAVMMLHVDAFHPDSGFQCKSCPTKFSFGGQKMMQHASQHLKRSMNSVDELLDLAVFSIPSDLRALRCKHCNDGVFLSQELSEAINHVLTIHPSVNIMRDTSAALEFSCQLCLYNVPDEKTLTEHIYARHTSRLTGKVLAPVQRFVKKEEKKNEESKRKFKESPGPSPKVEAVLRPKQEFNKSTGHIKPQNLRKRTRSPDLQTRGPVPIVRSPMSNIRASPPKTYKFESPPRRYSRSKSPRKHSRTKSPRRHSRSPFRRHPSRSPGGRYRSRTPPPRRLSPEKRQRNSRSPQGGYYRRSRTRSPSYRTYRSGSPPRETWSSQIRSPDRRSRSRSSSRRIRRRTTISLSRSRSRSRSHGSKRHGGGLKVIQEGISKQIDRTHEESKILSKLRKNLVTKKTVMEKDLRIKLESKKVKMLDSRTEGVKLEKSASDADSTVIRVCPFCVEKVKDDDELLEHMKMSHQGQMFGCSKCYSSLQPCISWSVNVMLQHLAHQHKLNVSISEAISSYVVIPPNLHRINCKLCPPPHILGAEGFWVGSDLQGHMASIEKHFESVHGISEVAQVVAQLELVCRGCDATFTHSGRLEWVHHVKKNHERLNRPNKSNQGPRKRCDYCGEDVVQTETIRHIKETHSKETFQCKVCLEADPTCFPFYDTIKEMTGHMVMKHGDQFTSYYDHMIYPVTLYGSLCSNTDCATKGGKALAFDPATIGKHLRAHQAEGGAEFGELYCRCCDRVKERFKSIVEVNEHISKRHKQILKWKEANGNH